MKSLVALLDRKKKDRDNTLVQVPFPSTLPHSAVHQDGLTAIHGVRRTSTPSSFLRPRQQHRAVSDSGHMHRPLLSEPSSYYRGHSLAHSASYYTDSDDGTFVDPFAPSPTKLAKPIRDPPRCASPRRGSEPNTANMFAPSSYHFRCSQEPSATPLAINEPPPRSGAVGTPGGKGRWLRERRSLTSLLRPQQPHNPGEPVPTVPPLPGRTLERKSSSFFARTRSGSTPSASQTSGGAHTPPQPYTGLKVIQFPTSANPQCRTANSEPKHGASYRGSVPLTLASHSHTDSPDSWVRVGGVGRETGLPAPPNTRRRAISVPLPPQQSTEPPPPIPEVQLSKYDSKSVSTGASSKPVRTRRPELSTECNSHRSHNRHGTKSASVSAPGPARFSTNDRSGKQDRSALQHGKQLSVGTSEGLVLKSALKHRPAEVNQSHWNALIQPVKPLKICKREVVHSKINLSQLPILSSEGNLNSFQYPSVTHKDPTRATKQNNKSISGPSLQPSLSEILGGFQGVSAREERPVTSSATSGSFNNIMKGHGLSTSDSRSLPVLDNIWGSFVSETAFGSSLPPSPIAPTNVVDRMIESQEADNRGRNGHNRMNINSANTSSVPHSKNPWKPGSAPPSQPPVAGLPPVPAKSPPALIASSGSVAHRKRSHSSTNAVTLLTPPTSPTEGVELQGLDHTITSSASGNVSSHSGDKSSASRQQLGPRLARSVSSPSIRTSASPEIVYSPIDTQDPGAKSYRSVHHQSSRSVMLSRTSHSNFECSPASGTLIAVPPSVVNLTTSDFRTSSGPFITLRKESSHPVTPECYILGASTRTPGTVSGGISGTFLGMFPQVPSNRVWPQGEMMSTIDDQDVGEREQCEEPVLTPPVTPAWAVHVFDADAEDNLQLGRMEHNASSDRIPLARLGNLAQMRRQKGGDMRSGSTQFPMERSHRLDMSLAKPEKSDMHSSTASRNTTLLARNVL
ncbi:unnamed protein product [Rhizoctonia solani]|uniref:Uncharacterized protein n=1 Tax=Rhizoctonia solani TaxID=456999 RepID=A0A8H3A1Z7_9AGAM|nr:unnamed protein product [Rhizoctonia solani]